MNGLPTSFWGKLEQDDSGATVCWHTLVDHCADVAACFDALLEQDVVRVRIARTGGLGDLTEPHRARLYGFAFHCKAKEWMQAQLKTPTF